MSPQKKYSPERRKQNLTVRLERGTIHKAKILVAKHSISVSDLLARQIEALIAEEEACEDAQRRALALLNRGFDLGGEIRAGRDELHER